MPTLPKPLPLGVLEVNELLPYEIVPPPMIPPRPLEKKSRSFSKIDDMPNDEVLPLLLEMPDKTRLDPAPLPGARLVLPK